VEVVTSRVHSSDINVATPTVVLTPPFVHNSVAIFLGLMHESFGCSYSDWTGPGVKSLCSTKFAEASGGDDQQAK
jgi:hypothetical protein